MDTINWRFSSPVSPLDQALTPDAQHSSSAGTPVKVDWPYAVGSLDFNLFDNQENSCVQTFFTGMNPAWGSQGQYCQIDDNNTPLSPLEKLQRKWGIGDRKTRGKTGANKLALAEFKLMRLQMARLQRREVPSPTASLL